ncbi:MAG: hypothetical protein ACK41D_01570 [Rubricoccaceae bacterium]
MPLSRTALAFVAFALVSLLPAAACAQEAAKPSATGDPGQRRADSIVVRDEPALQPAAGGASAEMPAHGVAECLPSGELRPVVSDTLALALGETTVYAGVHVAPAPEGCAALHALVVHDDEDTAVGAGLDVLRLRGGRLVELLHDGSRNVTFSAGGRRFVADPNRIFTDAGRRATLRALSADRPEARRALERFADALLAVYAPEGAPEPIVALHNNTDGRYSALSYRPGQPYAADADALHLAPGADEDDFFFVTTRALFDALAAGGFNVVLQNNDAVTDDGSLSVWAAQAGVPYVNVEAEHGHRAEQVRMVLHLLAVLDGQP